MLVKCGFGWLINVEKVVVEVVKNVGIVGCEMFLFEVKDGNDVEMFVVDLC